MGRADLPSIRPVARTAGLLLSIVFCAASAAEPLTASGTNATDDTGQRIQVLEGRVSARGLRHYRLLGLQRGEVLFVHVESTSGYLDPLAALLRPAADPRELTADALEEQVRRLAAEHDPIEATRRILDRYALAGNDDFEGQYYSAFSFEIPADGDYRLVIGSSFVRPSEGGYRLLVGIDAPGVVSGSAEAKGPAFVFPERAAGAPERRVASIHDAIHPDREVRFYHLTDLAKDATFYAYAEAVTGDLKPVLTLYDHSDKPLAFGNFTATEPRAVLTYRLPEMGKRYRLGVSGAAPTGEIRAGDFRLLLGLNTPEVLRGEGETTGGPLVSEPIPVHIGVKLEQITSVDQKAENFGVVAMLVMHWRDPSLAFDPETVTDRFNVFTGDAFATEMSRRGVIWPQPTLVNQQGNRWVQNRLVVIQPDGETTYMERFSATLQAPDFDFRNFPFDVQRFYIRVDLLTPEWMFRLREIENYSEIGEKLGEEEWVVTDFSTHLSHGEILRRAVSRFDFEFHAKRHIDYYVFRILLPLAVIIAVSWILFFLKDYAKRVDAAGANLLLFIAFNFAISSDLPRLGYLTFLDTLLISAFLVTAVVLILSVYLRRQDMKGRHHFVATVDRYVIVFYPLAYIVTIATVTVLFQ
jgi:hypothetical protein